MTRLSNRQYPMLQARDEFRHTDIRSKDPRLPLTRYFNPTAYRLTISQKTALH